MNTNQKLELPKELEKYRKQIENTVEPFVGISGEKGKTALHQSKFAGDPYLPKTIDHPIDVNQKPMILLAQLNFEEIPELEGMPKQGILQFYIAADDDLMGLNFDDQTKQDNFRIIFHSQVEKDEALLVTDFSYIGEAEENYSPMEHEVALSFEVDYGPVSVADYRNDNLLGTEVDLNEYVNKDGEEKELWEIYSDTFLGEGHKIGGYPFFTQDDPRDYNKTYREHNILLLQIDSDSDNGILWGDCGIANFFIRKNDLQNLDFSKVVYNWDCH